MPKNGAVTSGDQSLPSAADTELAGGKGITIRQLLIVWSAHADNHGLTSGRQLATSINEECKTKLKSLALQNKVDILAFTSQPASP